MGETLLIWGAGAIGGTLGAYWARAGLDVLMVDVVAEHAEACSTRGLTIEGPVDEFCQIVPTVTPDQLEGTYSCIVLAVKAHHTQAALRDLTPHLADDGYVLSAQNGLNELFIARSLGEARTMGCFVNFGADWHGAGRILFGNRGAVVVGEAYGDNGDRARRMHELLSIFEPDAVLTDDIWAYLWGKLGYGAMLFATALTDDSMTANFDDPARTRAWVTLGREVMSVAAARNVMPKGFNGFEPAAFMPGASYADAEASVAALAEFNRHTAKTHSGIWRDLAVRKRPTEVDAQIGIIAEVAADCGIGTPGLQALVELIHDIEQGRRPQSPETLKLLIDRCN
ncbi:ketopantoate reductase family protein [Pelagibius sp. Alg239-R121]|uniref:ketopantoate reductase family protein n=1 Tax=Pelagibius sp. Alg239-R121 TaxID=2993448 RepID=UPI0024A6CEA7|nr:2-dehydropantoate 2-reductase N-terminal domain-containing protein [Pelagibius sp. Alg239-R121]